MLLPLMYASTVLLVWILRIREPLQKAEALKQEKADRERDLQVLSDSSGASGHQKLRVCDVCGAYLSILDSDRRLADHFGGRVSSLTLPVPMRLDRVAHI